MKEATSIEGVFLVSATPHIGKPRGWGSGNVVAAALAESLGKSYPWAVGFFFADLELSMNIWTVIAGISGFDDYGLPSSSSTASRMSAQTFASIAIGGPYELTSDAGARNSRGF